MKNIQQVKAAANLAQLFAGNALLDGDQDQNDIFRAVLSTAEYNAYEVIADSKTGPFASHDHWDWDGVAGALDFWKEAGLPAENWQRRQL